MYVDTGQYLFHINSKSKKVFKNLSFLYEGAIFTESKRPADYSVSLKKDSFLRRFIKPQITFYLGNEAPFKPLPESQIYPVVEWGMNWCIAATDFNHLIIHAAVLVKNDQAIIFPAAPGSGKSTLSSYFSLSGWQLYSDEMAIIELNTLKVKPLFRPICLKNDSITLVKKWFPDAKLTEKTADTQKGDVAHLKATAWSDFQRYKPVDVSAIVFPKYNADIEGTQAYMLNKVEGFNKLSGNAFNYNILAEKGFNAMGRIIDRTTQAEIFYNDLSDVITLLDEEFINE